VAYDHDWFLDRIKERRPNDYKDFEFIEKYKSSLDNIKKKYADSNGIYLLVIPYTVRKYKEVKRLIKQQLI